MILDAILFAAAGLFVASWVFTTGYVAVLAYREWRYRAWMKEVRRHHSKALEKFEESIRGHLGHVSRDTAAAIKSRRN